MTTPRGYREIRIAKTVEGSAGAKLHALTQHIIDIGEWSDWSHAWHAIRARWPTLYLEYLSETGEAGEERTMSKSVSDYQQEAQSLVDAGTYLTLDKAMAAVHKRYYDANRAAMQKARPQPHGDPGVIGEHGAPPRRQVVPSHPEELSQGPGDPRLATHRTPAHEEIDRLCAKEQEKNPALSANEALAKVLSTPLGKELGNRNTYERRAMGRR
jgi:hypothetical protein